MKEKINRLSKPQVFSGMMVKKEKSSLAKISHLPSVAIVNIVGTHCNLRCRYCFHSRKHQDEPQLMKAPLLKKFIKEFLELPLRTCTFNWHGGEPLLAGLDFFKTVVGLQSQFSKRGQKIKNSVQTNGTLIDEKWASFFKTHNFGIGVSLDGNEESHNHFRVDSNNRGSFKRVINGLKILREHGIEPGILMTLTRENVRRAQDNFLFFVENLKVKSWAINPYCDIESANDNETVNNRGFTSVLKTYIDLWLAYNDKDLQIREIDDFLGALLKKPIFCACNFKGLCWTSFCLDYDGKIYLCDSVLRRKEFFCGDLLKQSLFEVFASARWEGLIKQSKMLSTECQICKWRIVCGNGCPSIRAGGIRGKYYYCSTRKKIFACLKEILNKERR